MALISAAGAGLYFNNSEKKSTPELMVQEEVASDEENNEEVKDEFEPFYDAVEIQRVVDAWTASTSGSASVVIKDPENININVAEHLPSEQYFAASLYKLFVVYEGYKSLDDDLYAPDDAYVGDKTRLECLDAAIRSSDSPCGEKWLYEMGGDDITKAFEGRGIENTSLTAITTTAEDSALLLSLLWNGRELSPYARTSYLDSMLDQDSLYRRGLPSGFSEDVRVYNKVGWNLTREWHDSAIVDFGENRILVISVLSENVGMKKIAELATEIEGVILPVASQ